MALINQVINITKNHRGINYTYILKSDYDQMQTERIKLQLDYIQNEEDNYRTIENARCQQGDDRAPIFGEGVEVMGFSNPQDPIEFADSIKSKTLGGSHV
tara:strand:- start:268 stop:567 length:300 start_codon:yes stop_codon:yes gene_type:complete